MAVWGILETVMLSSDDKLHWCRTCSRPKIQLTQHYSVLYNQHNDITAIKVTAWDKLLRKCNSVLKTITRLTQMNSQLHKHLLAIWSNQPNLHVFWRKLKHLEETHADTCKLCTVRSQTNNRYKSRFFLMWGDSAKHSTTVPPQRMSAGFTQSVGTR